MCSWIQLPRAPPSQKQWVSQMVSGKTKSIAHFSLFQRVQEKHIKTYATCSIELWLFKITKKWEEMVSSDLKKQRHHFADKNSYSPSYGSSSTHVWI